MTGASVPCVCGTAADAAARGLLPECPRHGVRAGAGASSEDTCCDCGSWDGGHPGDCRIWGCEDEIGRMDAEEVLLSLADVCAERRFEVFGELVRTTRSGGLAIRGRGADGKLWRSGPLSSGELFERQLAIQAWSENGDGQMGTEGEQHEREIGRWRVDGRGQSVSREGELGLEVARVRAGGVVVR
jgi:hypothetical protein